MKNKATYLKILFHLSQIFFNCGYQVNDYKTHPCLRECNNKTNEMVCEYEWTIEWYAVLSKACLDCPFNKTNCDRKDCVSGNGVNRSIIAVNKMIPGPSINVCQHDTIKIKLKNNLHSSEATSIHWHGLKQNGTQYMDGVSMVTQCPVIAHSTFEYRFYANDYGTHLWHAHSGLQRADGAFGPIIVHERENPYLSLYDYDLPEHVIILNDWINDTIISKFSGHHHNDGDNKPTSILINGKGALKEFKNKIFTPRASFSVEPGKKYRFRLINGGILYCPIEFSIDKHNLTIIASDGKFVEPFEVESLIIYAGERFDFILDTSKQEIINYWIRAKGYADCNVNSVFELAILKYTPNDDLIPNYSTYNYTNATRSGLQLNPWNKIINQTNSNIYKSVDKLKAFVNKDYEYFMNKINATNVKKFYLGLEFNKINNPEFNDEHYYSLNMMNSFNRTSLYTPQINNISMHLPSMPVLYKWNKIPKQSICNDINRNISCPSNTEYCTCIYTYEFNIGDIVEFVIVDEGFTFQSNHPMHLHGHSFAVLTVEKLNASIKTSDIIQMDRNNKINRNFDRPPIKDTVTVPVGGYTIIRFIADNPGTWMLHCHLDFHSEVGMSLLIKIGNVTDLPKEPTNWPQCGDFVNEDESQSNFLNQSNKNNNNLKLLTLFFISYVIFILKS